jgi:ectoine hydroxylase-related dioxygenase (phytanoyl-CoA dioxygenase family)
MPVYYAVQEQLETHGFAIVDRVVSAEEVAELAKAVNLLNESTSARKRGAIFAIRNLLEECPEVGELAASARIRDLVEPFLGAHFFPVRGIFFDKIPNANWKVPWHQDLTIAVEEKVEVSGFGPWSIKADVLHVQPPQAVLEEMLTVRIHLDTCDRDNGALRVITGSHRHGRIPEHDMASVRAEGTECVCEVQAGGALMMRPLLLHASSPSTVPGHRRVIHLDLAAKPLPAGLRWLGHK